MAPEFMKWNPSQKGPTNFGKTYMSYDCINIRG
jgi:hypothetical protein